MMNYERYRSALERTYEDSCTVYRYGDVKDPISKVTKQAAVAIHSAVPCRLSQSTLPKDGQTVAQNDISYDAKLFVAPDLTIKQGDLLEVVRGGAARRYTAGEPFPYPTHQEISLHREDWA